MSKPSPIENLYTSATKILQGRINPPVVPDGKDTTGFSLVHTNAQKQITLLTIYAERDTLNAVANRNIISSNQIPAALGYKEDVTEASLTGLVKRFCAMDAATTVDPKLLEGLKRAVRSAGPSDEMTM